MKWSAFVGQLYEDGEIEQTYFDRTYDDWFQAAFALFQRLYWFRSDSCLHCVKQARAHEARLIDALVEPAEFRANVEGDDYLILEVAS